MARCETVKVKSDNSKSGFVVINKDDFVDGEHALYKEVKKRTSKPKPDK